MVSSRFRLFPALLIAGVAVAAAPSAAGSVAGGGTLYVTNAATDDLTVFRIGPDGRPIPAGPLVGTGDEPRGLVFAGDGRHAYVVNAADFVSDQGTVLAYSVDQDGRLRPSGSPVHTGGDTSFGIAIAPSGRALYVTNIGSGTVTAFTIDAAGRLHRAGEPVSTGHDSPRGIAVSPDGRFVFVSHGLPEAGRDDVIVTFAIRPDGTLAGVGRPAAAGSGATGISITADQRFLYVASIGPNKVFGFGVGRGGDLTPLPGSPYDVAEFPEGTALSPDGRLLFVTSPGPTHPDQARAVSVLAIGRDGALRLLPGSPFQAGQGPVGVSPTPDGRHLYVSNFDSDDVSAYDVGPGALRPIGAPVPTGGQAPSFQSVTVRPQPRP
jgi:YVTN family beta-propeller protein